MYPKIYYFAWFENMRKQKFEKNTAFGYVMKFFKELRPQEPPSLTDVNVMEKKLRQNKMHFVFGLFPNSSDPIYKTEYLEMANFYSHLPVYN